MSAIATTIAISRSFITPSYEKIHRLIVPKRTFAISSRSLQLTVKPVAFPERPYLISKNRNRDSLWAPPTRRLKKSEKNFPSKESLFLNQDESTTIPLPRHIELFVLPLIKLEVNYCSYNKDSDTLRFHCCFILVNIYQNTWYNSLINTPVLNF